MPDKIPLSPIVRSTLAEIADLMIPASDAHNVPSASDPSIMDEIEKLAQRDLAKVTEAAQKFGNLEGSANERAETFRQDHSALAATLEALIAHSYYRDARVMTSLGMEARAPFPKGFDVEQGDWSLLKPVRELAPIYRPVD